MTSLVSNADPGSGAEPLDLTELVAGCAQEPIHIPEAVQSWGALLAADRSGRVVVASANGPALLGEGAAPGVALGDLFDPAALPATPGGIATVALPAGVAEVRFVGEVRGTDPLRLFEVEPGVEPPLAAEAVYPRQRAVVAAGDEAAVLEVAVQEVQSLTGFDRVMAYRFDPEWNGEVAAEARRPGLGCYLGLWFPASDIPEQARALYRRSLSRLIADVDAPTVPLLHLEPAATAPLDLSAVGVRSVSPVHLQYLRNMGVRASMSLSIIVEGRLWGLVACHHTTGPHQPAPSVRRAAASLVELVAGRLEAFAERDRLAKRVQAGEVLAVLRARAEAAEDLAAGLAGAPALRALLGAGGVTVNLGGGLASAGEAPEPDAASAVVAASRAGRFASVDVGAGPEVSDEAGTGSGTTIASSQLESSAFGDGAAVGARPAGVLVAEVPGDQGGWIAWWRPELVREIRWAGDPRTKEVGQDPGGMPRLDPRRSFETFVERVSGRSRRWDDHDRWVSAEVVAQVVAVLDGRTRVREVTSWAVQHVLGDQQTVGVRGLDVAVRSHPAGGDPVGGDWHDVVPLPDGSVALAVGDVAGHGMQVAGAMAHLRHALRAYLVAYGGAPEALGHLDELVQHLLPGQVATALVCVVDVSGRRVEVASTGHLPPVLVTAAGAEPCAVRSSPAVGMRRRKEISSTVLEIGAGDLVVMYTDGLVERRHEPLAAAVGALVDDLGPCRGRTPEQVCDIVLGPRLAGASDDVTVVVFSPLADAAGRG
jgi:chemotaxis family two-component system sensor kinase Cph1